MLTRRSALVTSVSTALPAIFAGPTRAANSFQTFVAGIYAEAAAEGIRRDVLDAAFTGVAPNQAVIEKDRRQAEFNMTWPQYRALVISNQRIVDGRAAVAANRAVLLRADSYFRVEASVIAGIRRADRQIQSRRSARDTRLGGAPRRVFPQRVTERPAHPE